MTTHRPHSGTLYTPAMEHAERELHARIDYARRAIREADAVVEQIARHEDKPLTDEEVDQLKTYVTGYARTPAWDKVTARIAAGELTWREVVETMARPTDPDIAAAFRSLRTVPLPTPEQLTDLFGGSAPQPAEPAQPTHQPVDDDDYFEGFSIGGQR